MTDDYLKFIENLDYYLEQSLDFIEIEQSKHYQEWKDDKSLQNVPIGLLGDVEIVFLHYKNKNIAKQKWEKRVKRINKKNLIFKFSYMNNCHDDDIKRFVDMKLPGKKICFVKDLKMSEIDNCLVYYKGFEHDKQIYNDTYYWNKYIDVVEFINEGNVIQK